MVNTFKEKILECQDCGRVIKIMTDYEDQQVADNPYKFVGYCPECYKARCMGTWPNED